MLELNRHIVIFDTEYTAWEGSLKRNWSNPGEFKEVVQIAGIVIDTQNFTELDSYNAYIKPVRNPILSDYFIALTGITQEIVDRDGISVDIAYNNFVDWSRGLDVYSFGYDLDVIAENFQILNIAMVPPVQKFLNIKDVFEAHNINTEKYTSGTIIEYFSKKAKVSAHNALNDCRVVAEALQELSLLSNA